MKPNALAMMAAAALDQREQPDRVRYTLRYLGDPVLTTPCVPLEGAKDYNRYLVDDMRAVVQRYRGLGLAANQVGALQRVALITWERELHVTLNPRLVVVSRLTETDLEGCLSIPGFTTTVTRAYSVTLEYEDELFVTQRVELTGLAARCAQHEIDHLDGKTLVDGLSRQQRRQAERLVAKVQR